IGLVYTAQFLAALLRRLKRHMSDTPHFCFGIMHRVKALALTLEWAFFNIAHAAWLAEVDIAGKLAHNKDVEARYHLRLERRRIGKLGIQDCRTQVGKQPQRLAQA